MTWRRSALRRGLSFLEILLGISILALGVLPVLDLLVGARRALSDAREVLHLESRALEVLARARATVAARLHLGTPTGRVLALEGEDRGVRWVVRVRSLEPGVRYWLGVRTEAEGRYFELGQVISDPRGSFFRSRGAPPELPLDAMLPADFQGSGS